MFRVDQIYSAWEQKEVQLAIPKYCRTHQVNLYNLCHCWDCNCQNDAEPFPTLFNIQAVDPCQVHHIGELNNADGIPQCHYDQNVANPGLSQEIVEPVGDGLSKQAKVECDQAVRYWEWPPNIGQHCC